MKTSKIILTVYALIAPFILVTGFVLSHDFDVTTVIRGQFTHPKTWKHLSADLESNSFKTIHAHNTTVFFSDTVPTNTLGYRYFNEKLKPTFYIKDDTLHLWSVSVPNSNGTMAYFFINPKNTLTLVGDGAQFRGDFIGVENILAHLLASEVIMQNGSLNKLVLDVVKNSRVEVRTDSISGNPINSIVNFNDDAIVEVSLDEKSKMTLSKNPLSLANPNLTGYYDFSWGLNAYNLGRTITINLEDSIYQAQRPRN